MATEMLSNCTCIVVTQRGTQLHLTDVKSRCNEVKKKKTCELRP